MSISYKKCLMMFLFMLLLSSSALATTTATSIPGREVNTPRDEQILWQGNQTIGIPVLADNSYFCYGIGARSSDSIRFVSEITNLNGFSAMRGDTFGQGSSINANQAISFLSRTKSGLILLIDPSTTGAGSGQARGRVLCKNTTLFGNFNTVNAANPVNFLEINNFSDIAANVQIVLRRFDGVEIHRDTIDIGGNQRRDIAIHDISDAGNTFGSITLGHDGGLGSISANITKYKFDGVNLDITATEPLRLKDQ